MARYDPCGDFLTLAKIEYLVMETNVVANFNKDYGEVMKKGVLLNVRVKMSATPFCQDS